ncbi:uncharacterized protein N7477_004988 [Penicillium maclennaniae]|uniref:uncharacterized protein n=1 Tax=Penicillium maclennaniae TaxID=1343394 RepID=UPI002541D6C0|nr:uncharacterized protein N7477_004988 [Penicillium maclennaniae]KAJ5675054.1 hypothetical protein N7477_004988 [Penicillium maclennaniae]
MAFSTASPYEESNVSCEIGTGASLVLTASASDLVVPVAEEYHVQEYLSKRTALLAEEKMLRHDFAFKLSMSPKVHQAAAIVSRIRAQEIQNLRLNSVEGSRLQMMTTQLYQRIQDMPKGALLHAPLEQMVEVDWLIDRMFTENDSGNAASCMVIFLPNADRQEQQHPSIALRFLGPDTLRKLPICFASESVWTETRDKLVLCPLKEAAQYFPCGGQTGFKAFLQQTWESTLTTRADSAPGSAASCSFLSILLYDPILRTAVRYVSQKLRQAHFSYAELRLTLPNDDLCSDVDNPVHWHRICHIIQEEIDISQRDPTTPLIRLIWTSPLNPNSENIRKGMEHCMLAKKSFPRLICGYDFVQRQHSQPLLDLLPLILGFQQMTHSERVNIPLGFDVGGCLRRWLR